MATWPPVIDDDGTGTTGTPTDYAFFQLVKTYIDQLSAQGDPVIGSFTPIDRSGAGLTLGGLGGRYCKIGRFVAIFMHVTYPATANNTAALLGTLPFANNNELPGGMFSTYGVAHIWHLSASQTAINVYNPSTGAPRTNADLSGSVFTLAGLYFTD